MSMSKKDFEALARALKGVRPEPVPEDAPRSTRLADVTRRSQWRRCVNAVADACIPSNSNFNAARFLEACDK
jgi:hypothetical protein